MIPDADAFLVRLTAELEQISAQQHALARRKAMLRDAATRLRLGDRVDAVEWSLRVETERDALRERLGLEATAGKEDIV